jgi:hypothetical protein
MTFIEEISHKGAEPQRHKEKKLAKNAKNAKIYNLNLANQFGCFN